MTEPYHVTVRRSRAGKAAAVTAVAVAGLVLGFVQLQLTQSPVYAVEAAGHRPHTVPVEAARGSILDRHGEVLADNETAYVLSLLPVASDMAAATLAGLGPFLGLDTAEVRLLGERQRRQPRRPLVIDTDLDFQVMARIEEAPGRFPGVLITTRPARRYPAGAAASHLVAGVERQYDQRLTGRNGMRFIAVDRAGRPVGPLPHRLAQVPVPGETLRLSVDLGMQGALASLIPPSVRAGAVVLDPTSGAILALYSSPANESADRAVGVRYRAGHAWQVVTAATALRDRVVDPDSTLPLPCRGGFRYGDRYLQCRDRQGHGALDLAGALRHGCDVYFYQLGLKLGLDRLVANGTRLGFGGPTGVDLPGEDAGALLPADWLSVHGSSASADELAMRLAAGDAPVTASVLQMARLFAAIAGSGALPRPGVLAGGVEGSMEGSMEVDPAVGANARLDPVVREHLRAALSRAISPGFGGDTEHDWEWWGKGTPAGMGDASPDWFVGFTGPRRDPARLVLAVVLEDPIPNLDAAGVARLAVDRYVRENGGRPIFQGSRWR